MLDTVGIEINVGEAREIVPWGDTGGMVEMLSGYMG